MKVLVAVLAISWTSLFAVGRPCAAPRPYMSASLYSTYTDNVFGTYAATSDWIWSGDVAIEYEGPSDLSFTYSGSLNTFAIYEDLTNHSHRIGLGYFRYLGEGQDAIDVGAQFQTHLDRPSYAYYDYTEWKGHGDAKCYFGAEMLGRIGYQVRGRRYPNFDSEDFAEHSAYLQVNRFLETRTTVRLELDWGNKRYSNGTYGDIHQVTSSARIAQSIGERTGVYIEYRHRFTPSRSEMFRDPVDGYGDSPFKDRYTYQGEECRGVITYLAPWRTKIRTSVLYATKLYTGTPALDLYGVPLRSERMREDRRTQIYLRAERPFPRGERGDTVLRLEYQYRRNASNDPYYDYRAHTVSAGIEAAF